jgi:hypothetical protein
MKTVQSNHGIAHSKAEICINLWYFTNDSRIVQRIAGKAYALTGTEKEKLSALQLLAGGDHLTAIHDSVPGQIKYFTPEGDIMHGAVPTEDIFSLHTEVFGKLMDKLEGQLPVGIQSIKNEYAEFTLKLPGNPLCVTTAVYEKQDGTLIARTS